MDEDLSLDAEELGVPRDIPPKDNGVSASFPGPASIS
jgi:hypothetical protein